MKLNKIVFILCLIIILSVTSVSASEDLNQTLSISDDSISAANTDNTDEVSSSSANTANENLSSLNVDYDIVSSNDVHSIWYVNCSKNNGGDGKSEQTAFTALKSALNVCNDGDTIYIASGTYSGNGNLGLVIDKNLNIEAYGDNDCIFDGQSKSKNLNIYSNCINITGLTFRNFYLVSPIIFNNPIVNSNINCTFINNYAFGCILHFTSNITNSTLKSTFIKNSVIIASTVAFQGDVFNCYIDGIYGDNYGYFSGGNYFQGIVSNSYIGGVYSHNSASNDGGAMIISHIVNSTINGTFTNNKADNGGAIAIGFNENTKIDGTYSSNNATLFGGALFFYDVSINCTLYGTFANNVARNGSDVYFVSHDDGVDIDDLDNKDSDLSTDDSIRDNYQKSSVIQISNLIDDYSNDFEIGDMLQSSQNINNHSEEMQSVNKNISIFSGLSSSLIILFLVAVCLVPFGLKRKK